MSVVSSAAGDRRSLFFACYICSRAIGEVAAAVEAFVCYTARLVLIRA